jgi:signal transduction histidine kinase
MVSVIASPLPATVKLGLRARVAALCAMLGFVVSSCLALVAVHFSDSYVHRLIDEMLRVEGDYLRERFAVDGIVARPRSKHFLIYTSPSSDNASAPPPELAAVEPGIHELEDEHGERHAMVYDVNGRRLYVVLDIGLESVRERRLARDLIALVLFGSALSCWLGWFWAGRAIEPVRRLAEQVGTLEPSSGVAALAPEYADDEVGALAQAFDRYQEKLREYVRRERSFTADASHELRTPLAVIRGAIEVLLDHGNLDAPTATRLKRIQRGADELRDLLDALLVLARGDERAAGNERTADLDAVVDGLLRERRDAFQEKRLQLDRAATPGVAVAAPPKVIGVVIGNLLRAVTQFADGGILRVRVAADALTIAHEGERARPSENGPRRPALDVRDQILGLAMVRRVCERWQWTLDENIDADGAHAFVLRFGAS